MIIERTYGHSFFSSRWRRFCIASQVERMVPRLQHYKLVRVGQGWWQDEGEGERERGARLFVAHRS